jgi:hypothetical protein
MSVGITFQHPAVWWAALTVAFPVAIHLLTRARRSPLRFPTVRFLEPAHLSAVRRSRIEDWPLLLLRAAILLLAVAALAGPIVVTPAREAAWRARVARAVVLEDRTAAPDDEVRSAAVAAVFARLRLRDAVSDAVRWLERQAPSTRELVVMSAFRRGSTDAADFAEVPPHVGIRLTRTGGGSASRTREISRLTWRDGRAVRITEQLVLTSASTEVRELSAQVLEEPPVRVLAMPAEQPVADAALRAVLHRGLRLPPAGLLERIDVEWPGSVDQLAALLETRLSASIESWEPETLSDEELTSIRRSPAPAGAPTPVDAGDRRMVWALLIALVVAETFMRRGPAWS